MLCFTVESSVHLYISNKITRTYKCSTKVNSLYMQIISAEVVMLVQKEFI
jgi:hypothetical protein